MKNYTAVLFLIMVSGISVYGMEQNRNPGDEKRRFQSAYQDMLREKSQQYHSQQCNEEDFVLTPLHQALADDSSLEVIETLIQRGADVNAKDRGGLTPLFYAIRFHNYVREVFVQTLLNAGADINAITPEGLTLLHYATSIDVDIVAYLLKSGARVNAVFEGSTPLDWALSPYKRSDKNLALVRTLIAAEGRVQKTSKETLLALFHDAIGLGDYVLASFCLQNGIAPDELYIKPLFHSALYTAIQHHRYDMVELLLKRGASISTRVRRGYYDRPIHAAIKHDAPKILERFLFLKTPNPEAIVKGDNDKIPMRLALDKKSPIMVAMILKATGATPYRLVSNEDYSLFRIAGITDPLKKFSGVPEMIKRILNLVQGPFGYKGIGVNEQNLNSRTLVQILKYCTYEDINQRDSLGATVLMYAAMQGHVILVRLLLQYGADPLIATNQGHTVFDLLNNAINLGLRPEDVPAEGPYENVNPYVDIATLCYEHVEGAVLRPLRKQWQPIGIQMPPQIATYMAGFVIGNPLLYKGESADLPAAPAPRIKPLPRMSMPRRATPLSQPLIPDEDFIFPPTESQPRWWQAWKLPAVALGGMAALYWYYNQHINYQSETLIGTIKSMIAGYLYSDAYYVVAQNIDSLDNEQKKELNLMLARLLITENLTDDEKRDVMRIIHLFESE